MPTRNGAINGGLFEKSKNNPIKHPSFTIAVDDLNKAMEDVKKAGGKIVGKPMEIKGYGMYVVFNDSEGNSLSMMESKGMPEEAKDD